MSHPAIKHAAGYGVEDDDRREHIHAAIVLRPGAHCTDQDLSGVVAYRLSAAHVPAQFYRWPELPLTSRGKPDVAQLRFHSAQRLSHR
jgi:acyl-coenzyme A synthetase/AMP-(fatty) acid ligase